MLSIVFYLYHDYKQTVSREFLLLSVFSTNRLSNASYCLPSLLTPFPLGEYDKVKRLGG